jgi:Na+/proline symporter
MNRNWRDLIGGIFLVPALHLGFILLLWLMVSIFNSGTIGLIFSISVFWIGIAQFVYLIPVMLVFRKRNRFEVIKGISIGIVLTILINGLCFGSIVAVFGVDLSELLPVAFIGIVVSMLILCAFNYRSRPK